MLDDYPTTAAEIVRDLGPVALDYVSAEVKGAMIDADAERACFWMLVRARIRPDAGEVKAAIASGSGWVPQCDDAPR